MLTADGQVIAGLADGSVLRIDPSDGTVTTIADTGGRPLGLHADPDGSVLICDAARGLLELHPDGSIEVLVDEIDGAPLPFVSNVVRDTDGTIYFSASTTRYSLAEYMGDLLEHSETGRLFRRDPSGKVQTLLDGLKFANGVVLSPTGPVWWSPKPRAIGCPAIGSPDRRRAPGISSSRTFPDSPTISVSAATG
ncbi:SMP-30/gluconolactonase/LRE family protein [Nocardia arthritidis]|uniref:SMP-30/gluconolactonase/LRE family protein n=1 Tax=Nocardia arthritidis TaxID=228602 RepID=UPI001EECD34F|nr:SMP-30/gluconolactonase/LRE family protein [Nocardia arthritidis]